MPSQDVEIYYEVIGTLLDKIDALYVFPEVATKVRKAVEDRKQVGEYDDLTYDELRSTLTRHLQEATADKHLRLWHRPPTSTSEPSDQPSDREEQARQRNYGFHRVERLPGNIGYLKLNAFERPQTAGETAVAAMRFLAHTNAMIIDLRDNGGGDPSMVALISSYFFETSVHLNDLYWRKSDSNHQYWTLPYVPGIRYGDKPLYVLTGPITFSAAEEFANNLKVLKRAVLVGETTGGGANPGGMHNLGHGFEAFIPSGRATNPTTLSNWEGVGVLPDIEASAAVALNVAHAAALEALMEKIEIAGTGLEFMREECRDELNRLRNRNAKVDDL